MRFLFFILFASTTALIAQPSNKLELLDIYDLEYISDPQISPDGKQIIYVRNFKDVMTDRNLSNLWITDYDGSNNRPLTQGNQNDHSPRWSNDGNKVVYKSNESGKTQLYLYSLTNKSTMKLTNSNLGFGGVTWSHDDEFLAFTQFTPVEKNMTVKMPKKPKGAKWQDPPKYIDDLVFKRDGAGFVKPGYAQIYTLPISGGTPRQVTFGEYNNSTPAWSADGNSLIFSSNRNKDRDMKPSNSDLHTLNLITLETTQLTDRLGPENNPKISPDGKTIAFRGYDDKFMGYQLDRLYTCNLDGSNLKLISGNFDREVDNITWATDGKSIYFQYDDKGNTKLAKISLSGNVTDFVSDVGGLSFGRPYSGGQHSVSGNGKFAYTFSNQLGPAELGTWDAKSKARQLTAVNKDVFAYKKPSPIEEIWFKSSHDQRDVQGWIVKPPNFDPNKKYPMILEIHGGPFTNYGFRYSSEVQLYASAGYVVLYINPRGSTSYGEEFGNLIHHNYPGQDYDDLMSGVDALLAKGYVDEDRLFVTGGSGGGVLTAWIVGNTDRFRAAVVAKPVINWYSFALYADISAFVSQYWFPGMPWDHTEHYMKRSPISLVKNVKTPTMLLTGEVDYRTPMAETEQYYTALKMLGVETALVRIQGASHGIASKPSNLIGKVTAILQWFEKYDQSN